jgi:hypothetical protein
MSTQVQLRPHQKRGDVAMQQYNKGQLIYPTGGGKTPEYDYGCCASVSV